MCLVGRGNSCQRLRMFCRSMNKTQRCSLTCHVEWHLVLDRTGREERIEKAFKLRREYAVVRVHDLPGFAGGRCQRTNCFIPSRLRASKSRTSCRAFISAKTERPLTVSAAGILAFQPLVPHRGSTFTPHSTGEKLLDLGGRQAGGVPPSLQNSTAYIHR
jgi:hypothetical protein